MPPTRFEVESTETNKPNPPTPLPTDLRYQGGKKTIHTVKYFRPGQRMRPALRSELRIEDKMRDEPGGHGLCL
jgi:hypothetical protein